MDDRRKQFFEQLQSKLEFSSQFGFSSLKQTVLSEMTNIHNYSLPQIKQIHSATVDQLSKELYPENDDFCLGYLPNRIYGDGNCLCRAGSMYVFGTEENHIEIRVRLVEEMVLYKDWYLADKSFHQYAHFSGSYRPSDNLRDIKGIEAVYIRNVIKLTEINEWGDMWNLIALSSVLGCPVYSIYPDLAGTQQHRHFMHRRIDPRQTNTTETVRFMRTTTLVNSKDNTWWLPNHFVTCTVKTTQTATSPANNRKPLTLADFFSSQQIKSSQKQSQRTKNNVGMLYRVNKELQQKEKIPSNSKQQLSKLNAEKFVHNVLPVSKENVIETTETNTPIKEDSTITLNTNSNLEFKDSIQNTTSRDNECDNSKDIKREESTAKKYEKYSPEQKEAPIFATLDNINNSCTGTINDCNTNNATEDKNEYNCEGIPYVDVSLNFYKVMGQLAAINEQRDKTRYLNPVKKDDHYEDIKVQRGKEETNKNTILSTLETLQKKAMCEIKKEKRAHLHGVIACGQYILENGPLVRTQTLCGVLQDAKSLYKGSATNTKKRKLSIELLETLAKYLPVMQIYINRTGFIMEYRKGNIQAFVESMSNCTNLREAANKNLEDSLDNLKDYLGFVDTELDRSIIRSILVNLYSINSVSRLPGAKHKTSLQRSRDEIPLKLQKFKDLKKKTLPARNDMTNHQQHMLHKRLIAKVKAKEFKTRAAGGGREKIADKFPQLREVLELSFGEGSKIHPRLTTETRYKDPNLALTMPQAREILLAAATDKIPNIALSTCYTYTQNFRKNTKQAIRHHFGQEVNANISLKKLPRVGMVEEKSNAHYCRSLVNFHLETAAANDFDYFVDAKDAKGIVCADIDPVQNMGKSWKNVTRLDHQFDQSRTNACTPMSHLFLQSVSTNSVVKSDNLTLMNITRTGQPVTLVNLSFYEPETVFRCFNELFLLLANPALDSFFRNSNTGTLKRKWIFVVDNGPSEAPASCLVRMLLVRLVNFLHLDKVSQISFEKLNSKDNPAERPHASENLALSRHGPFSTHEIFPYKNAKPGSSKHFENMEFMAKEVISCLRTAKFGNNQFFSFRGVKDQYIFNDETALRNFLKLSEQGKDECIQEYSGTQCLLLTDLCNTWNLAEDYTGSYLEDYNQLCNSLFDDVQTAWLTEYQATIYSKNPESTIERFEKDPLPDYIRWIRSSGELHYMSYEGRLKVPNGDWDVPEMFLPSNIVSLLSQITDEIPEPILQTSSLLAWLTPIQLKEELQKINKKTSQQMEKDEIRDKWKDHPLFNNHSVADLIAACKELKLPCTSASTKTDLIEILAKARNIQPPALKSNYDGNLSAIPVDINSLSNLSIFYLRSILKYHNINFNGTKDELIMKVFLLRHKRSYTFLETIVNKLSKIGETIVLLIIWQRRHYNEMQQVYRTRLHSKCLSTKSVIPVPDYITEETVHDILDPLFNWLDSIIRSQVETDQARDLNCNSVDTTSPNEYEQCKETGAKVKIFWSREEIGTSDWKVGWYIAQVLNYDSSFDSLDLEYIREPGSVYSVDFSPSFAAGKLKFVSSPFY